MTNGAPSTPWSLRTCSIDLARRCDLARRRAENTLRGRCGTVPQHPAGGHIQHLSPPRVYSSFFVARSNSVDRGVSRAAVYREHGRLPELSLRRDAVARGGRPGQARAPRALLGGGATASPSPMKTINAAFSQPLRRPRTKLNWSTIVGQRRAPRPGGRETLGGAAGVGTRRAVSRPILGAIRRVYVPTAPVTRPLCSGTGAVSVLHPRCGSDTQPATARVSAGPEAAAASAVVAETAPDWPGGLRPSTAAPSPGEWAASSAHGTTRLARYARASLALLLARLSAEPLSMNDAPHDEMLSDSGRP